MRENQSKIAFLFGVDDHWGPQELYEEVRMNSSNIFFSLPFSRIILLCEKLHMIFMYLAPALEYAGGNLCMHIRLNSSLHV